jgi:hypothetical protein
MTGIQRELERWRNEQWAVDSAIKTIYQIQEKEIVGDVLLIYGEGHSNASHCVDTLMEASGIEKIREIIRNHFFQSEEYINFEANKKVMKEIKVADEYRTNPLSIQPGGDEIKVYLMDGMVYTYDKIKSPAKYINRLEFKDNIVRIDINGKQAWASIDPGAKYWEI